MLNLVKGYVKNEDAIDVSVQNILFIVIAIVIVGVIAFIAYNIINSNKSSAEQGMSDYENTVGKISGLGK